MDNERVNWISLARARLSHFGCLQKNLCQKLQLFGAIKRLLQLELCLKIKQMKQEGV